MCDFLDLDRRGYPVEGWEQVKQMQAVDKAGWSGLR